MKKLKILIIDRKLRAYVKNDQMFSILNEIKKNQDIDELWLLIEPDFKPDLNAKKLEYNYRNFEFYKTDDITEILKIEKPDVIIVGNDYDFKMRSFIPAAKFCKIPIILWLSVPTPRRFIDQSDFSMILGKYRIHKNKINEIVKRYLFMIKTYRKCKYSILKLMKIILTDFFTPFLHFQQWGVYGCDLILVTGKEWERELTKKKINSKIEIVGYPTMDDIFKKIQKFNRIEKRESDKKKIILMTANMVEHGVWTFEQWEKTITLIVNEIMTNLNEKYDFAIKIHPTGEKIEEYQKLIKKLGFNIQIYQKEDLVEILSKADYVITYGQVTGILHAGFLKIPVIVANFYNYSMNKMPFLKEKLAVELKNIDNLEEMLENIKFETVKSNLERYTLEHLYKFDDQSSNRTAKAIVNFTENYKK